jgi:hypothetical protein
VLARRVGCADGLRLVRSGVSSSGSSPRRGFPGTQRSCFGPSPLFGPIKRCLQWRLAVLFDLGMDSLLPVTAAGEEDDDPLAIIVRKAMRISLRPIKPGAQRRHNWTRSDRFLITIRQKLGTLSFRKCEWQVLWLLSVNFAYEQR